MTQAVFDKLFDRVECKDDPETITTILTSKKVDLKEYRKDGRSHLLFAIRKGSEKTVKKLILLGRDNATSEATISENNDTLPDFPTVADWEIYLNSEPIKNQLKLAKAIQEQRAAIHREPGTQTDTTKTIRKVTIGTRPTSTNVTYVTETSVPVDTTSNAQGKTNKATSESELTWLGKRLAAHDTPADLIALCEDKLVRQEGFGNARTLAVTPAAQFNQAYLQGLGITGLGVQQTLLSLHTESVEQMKFPILVPTLALLLLLWCVLYYAEPINNYLNNRRGR